MSEIYHACLYTAQGEIQCCYKTKKSMKTAKPKPDLDNSYLSGCATKPPYIANDPIRNTEVKVLDSELLQNW